MSFAYLKNVCGLALVSAAFLAAPTFANAQGAGSRCMFVAGVNYGAGDGPSSVAMGDLDGDLDLDLVTTNYFSGDISVLLNNGDGTFTPHVTYDVGGFALSVAIGDLDGDLDLDLVTANRFSSTVSVLLNNGDGTFATDVTYNVLCNPACVAIGDMDGDLDLDLVVANFCDNVSVLLLLNNGDGTFATDFTYEAGTIPASVAIGDLDGDLDLDLVVPNLINNNVLVLLNNGDGTFAADGTYNVGDHPRSVAIGDMDGDLDLDLAVANQYSNNISVLLNNGDGTFAANVFYCGADSPWSVAIGDLDGDHDLDLAVTSEDNDNVLVLQNNGDGIFAADGTYNVGVHPRSVAIGDLDGDLNLDLVTANFDSDDVSVLLNDRGDSSTSTVPDQLTVIRGTQIDGDITDVIESDDLYLKFQPGFTLNSNEPPVWVEFEGTLPSDSTTSLTVTLEASANTVNINQTIEAFNWITGQYEEVDSRAASFNVDSVVSVDLTDSMLEYVEGGTGAVKARTGWRATGPILLYPWTICIDHVVWTVVTAEPTFLYDNRAGGAAGIDSAWLSDFDDGWFGFSDEEADQFMLNDISGPADITSICWTGAYGNDDYMLSVDDNFSIFIYEGEGCLPSKLIWSENVGNVSRQESGYFLENDEDIYEYEIEISGLTLQPNTLYWVSIVNATFGDDDIWAWGGVAQAGSGENAYRRDGGNWRPGTTLLDYRIKGKINP